MAGAFREAFLSSVTAGFVNYKTQTILLKFSHAVDNNIQDTAPNIRATIQITSSASY